MLYIETIELSNCQQHADDERNASHRDTSNKSCLTTDLKQFCLSKAFLIGFEMDYPNQTVNLRHIASIDR